MQILGAAMLHQKHPTTISIAPAVAGAVGPGNEASSGLKFADTTGSDFAAWMVDAINDVLNSRPVTGTRPSGAFRRTGTFHQEQTSVWASSIEGGGPVFQVALCDDLKAALELQHRLNALLH